MSQLGNLVRTLSQKIEKCDKFTQESPIVNIQNQKYVKKYCMIKI